MKSARPVLAAAPTLLLALSMAGCGGSQQAEPAPTASSSVSRVAGDQQREVPQPSDSSASPAASSASPDNASPSAIESPSSTPTPAASSGGGSLPTPSGTTKPFQGTTLPGSFAGYNGTVTHNGTTTLAMYTGKTQDQMLMVSMVKGATEKVAKALEGPTVMDHAVCGKQVGVATCLLLLQDGYVHVQGTDKDTPETLAKASNQLWDALKS